MADITISDLELAPALTDDMVLPVENTTDTYAATLAMLRRLINKTFVEVANADFNALTEDGFYQCTGTPTNSPVAGAINWTLQVSAESGVVVQRAFSLDDNFANIYIRRWNGVTWTGWLEVGAGALANKANISLSNIDATGQAKFDAKANVNLDNLSATGEAKIAGSVPTGAILPYGGSTAPTGWLICNGGAISRTTYENLFAVIGTSYGAGDGSTTFNLPNFTGRYAYGGTVGTYFSESLPNIIGYTGIRIAYGTNTGMTSPFTMTNGTTGGYAMSGTTTANDAIGIDFSTANSIYKNNGKVMPDSVGVLFCIKY